MSDEPSTPGENDIASSDDPQIKRACLQNKRDALQNARDALQGARDELQNQRDERRKTSDPQPAKGDDEPKKGENPAKTGEGEAKKSEEPAKETKKPSEPPWYKRPGIVGPLILVFIIVVVGGALIWRHSLSYVSTDDAYVDGVSELASPQISGRITKILVDDNQDVKAGQVLVELDPADYQVRLDQANASRAQAEAQLAEARAQQTIYAAQLSEARSNLGITQANAINADHQLTRYQRLKAVNKGAVSAQQLDSAIAAATSANAQLDASRQAVSAAEAQMGYAASLILAAEAGIGSAHSQIAQAALTLSYTQIKARIDGRIANKSVAEGNFVVTGAPLMAIVPRDVYVTANLKETQLNDLKRGQDVTITVDAYPELKLTGRVDSVEPATGQTFSVLPAQNATGNWIKVVQRVPVKIVFNHLPDDPDRRLAPGMSAEISVTVR
jgi:membrane fusion protein (multidrug efflux system)